LEPAASAIGSASNKDPEVASGHAEYLSVRNDRLKVTTPIYYAT